METVPIKISLLLNCDGGTENEMRAFMHTWQLDILGTFVRLCKSSDLLLHILLSYRQSKFRGSGLVKKHRTLERDSGLSNF